MASHDDACVASAKILEDLGYVAFSLRIKWNTAKDRKEIEFPQRAWQNCKAGQCVLRGQNGLAIVTGKASDVLAIDIDHPKDGEQEVDGMEYWDKVVEEHGLPGNVMVAQTGSGGKHYLFSYSKSLEAGLREDVTGQSKLTIQQVKTTIDSRINNNCLIVAPSSYDTPTGSREYRWQTDMVASRDLDAAPSWLIGDLNNKPTKRKADNIVEATKKGRATLVTQETFQTCQPLLHQVGFKDTKLTRTKLDGFDFVADRSCCCPLCLNIHDSQEWFSIRLCEGCFEVRSYSSRCRSKLLGLEGQKQLSDILQTPTCDEPYVAIFATHFMLGKHHSPVIWTGRRWLQFQGHLWKPIEAITVRNLLVRMCVELMDKLARLQKAAEVEADLLHEKVAAHHAQERYKALLKGIAYIKRGGNQRNMMDCLKASLFLNVGEDPSGIQGKVQLDNNPYLLGCENGVVDLQTCQLRPGQPEDWVSKSTGYQHNGDPDGIATAVNFFQAIYPQEDERSVMQKWIGYNLLGHASEKRLCLMTDERSGDNGKSSVLKAMAMMLGDYGKTGKNSFLYKAALDTQTGNSHDAGLLAYKGVRSALFEELDGQRTLDGNLIKSLTNGVGFKTAARGCGAADEQQFAFVAKLTLAFNEGEMPNIRFSDATLQKRPFSILHRALFCRTPEAFEQHKGQPHTHLANEAIHHTMHQWISGVLSWALEGLEVYNREGFRNHALWSSGLQQEIAGQQEHCGRMGQRPGGHM